MLEHNYADVNGTRLHYVIDGDGPAMVFLHGFPDFWYLWKDQLAHFRRTHTVIAPDLRGYNLSDKPDGVAAYRLPTVAADIRGLVAHLGLDSIVLAGHDWGGEVAWEFAARYPDLVRRFIAVSVAPIDVIRNALRNDPERRRAWQYMLMVSCSQAERILRAGDFELFTQMVFGADVPPDYFTDADRAAYRRAWSQPGMITAATNYYRAARLLDYFTEDDRRAFLDWWTRPEWSVGGERFFEGMGPEAAFGKAAPPPEGDLLEDAAGSAVAAPTLMIIGERDNFALTDRFEWFESRAPRGEVLSVENAGHRVIHERSALVTERIQAFIA